MDNIEYRVWCEFTIEGEKHSEMAGPENWFLLTQSGHLMSHGPMSFDPNAEQEYDKLIVEFWTGKKDIDEKEIYDGDLILVEEWKFGIDNYSKYIKTEPFKAQVFWNDDMACWWYEELKYPEGGHPLANCKCRKIGDIHLNPELLIDS